MIEIRGYANTKFCFKKGQTITIEASGNIRIGHYVGYSDPDGRSSGLLGFSLEQYCLVEGINSSALIYRIHPNDYWKLAGKNKVFTAEWDGCLEFEVNEIDKSDNIGFYEVKVTIQ